MKKTVMAVDANGLIDRLRLGPYRREGRETRADMNLAADLINSLREHIADGSIVCDACGNDAGDDPLHFSGTLDDGSPCNHIHLCVSCGKGCQRIEIRHGMVCTHSEMAAMDNQAAP